MLDTDRENTEKTKPSTPVVPLPMNTERHELFYAVAGITIHVISDLPLTNQTFHQKFNTFAVEIPGKDTVILRHRSYLPEIIDISGGNIVYDRSPWIILKQNASWIYICHSPASFHTTIKQFWRGLLQRGYRDEINDGESNKGSENILSRRDVGHNVVRVAIFNDDHTQGDIYHKRKTVHERSNLTSLTAFPTDQIILARILADRNGCILHAAGVAIDGRGLLFVGHSDAGKSTMMRMLQDEGVILCDDRIIVQRRPEGYTMHGTWSHGDVSDVSAASVPVHAVFFLEQSIENRILPCASNHETIRRLLACLIKPVATADWWDKSMTIVADMARECPCYTVRFDLSGDIVDKIKRMTF